MLVFSYLSALGMVRFIATHLRVKCTTWVGKPRRIITETAAFRCRIEFYLHCLTPDDGIDMLSRNVGGLF